MKKFLSILLLLVLCVSFTACNKKTTTEDNSVSSSNESTETISVSDSDSGSSDASGSSSTTSSQSGNTSNSSTPSVSEKPNTGNSSTPSVSEKPNKDSSRKTSVSVKPNTGNSRKQSNVNTGSLTNAILPALNVKGSKVVFLTTDTLSAGSKKFIEGFKKAYGADIEWVSTPWNDLATNLSKMVLANNAPDLTILRSGYDFPMVCAKGLLQDIDGKVDLNSKLWEGSKWNIDDNKFQNKHYVLTTGISTSDNIWFNKNMMRDAGIEILPDVLYEQGKWDWTALLEIAKELTDTTAKTPTYGFGSDYLLLANDILASRGTSIINLSSNGTESLNLLSKEVTQAMNFYSDLYFKHKVMCPGGQEQAMFMAGRLGMLIQGSWLSQTNSKVGAMHKNGAVGLVPLPKWPGLDESHNLSASQVGIPKGAKNVNGGLALASYMRFLQIDKDTVNTDRNKVIKDGLLTEKEFGYLDKSAKSGFIHVSLVGDTDNWAWKPYNDLQAGDTWTTVVPRYEPQFQKCIDEYNALLK